MENPKEYIGWLAESAKASNLSKSLFLQITLHALLANNKGTDISQKQKIIYFYILFLWAFGRSFCIVYLVYNVCCLPFNCFVRVWPSDRAVSDMFPLS